MKIKDEDTGRILGSVSIGIFNEYVYTAELSISGSAGGYASTKEEAIEKLVSYFKKEKKNDESN